MFSWIQISLPVVGVERDERVVAARDDTRCRRPRSGLNPAFAVRVEPGHVELVDVRLVDLVECRVVRAVGPPRLSHHHFWLRAAVRTAGRAAEGQRRRNTEVKREAFFMWDAIGRSRGLNVLGYQMW